MQVAANNTKWRRTGTLFNDVPEYLVEFDFVAGAGPEPWRAESFRPLRHS